MNKNNQFTIGGDPEVFISGKNGEIHSSIPILKRDKHNPIVLDKKSGVKTYADNSLAEMAFNPSKSKKEFVEKYRKAFLGLQKYLGKNYRIKIQSAHFFKENELEAAHGIDPMQVGCSPEFNHWKREVNQLGEFTNTMRSGSSHIHIGHEMFKDINNKERALKMIEIFLGCSSVIWDNDKTSSVRREKYGTSGSFRPTDYGFETRFMSNYMLNSPKLVELAYDLIEFSLSFVFNDKDAEILSKVSVEDVQNAINKCDKDLAVSVLKQAGLTEELFKRVVEQSKKSYSTKDFYKEWDIKV